MSETNLSGYIGKVYVDQWGNLSSPQGIALDGVCSNQDCDCMRWLTNIASVKDLARGVEMDLLFNWHAARLRGFNPDREKQ